VTRKQWHIVWCNLIVAIFVTRVLKLQQCKLNITISYLLLNFSHSFACSFFLSQLLTKAVFFAGKVYQLLFKQIRSLFEKNIEWFIHKIKWNRHKFSLKSENVKFPWWLKNLTNAPSQVHLWWQMPHHGDCQNGNCLTNAGGDGHTWNWLSHKFYNNLHVTQRTSTVRMSWMSWPLGVRQMCRILSY